MTMYMYFTILTYLPKYIRRVRITNANFLLFFELFRDLIYDIFSKRYLSVYVT